MVAAVFARRTRLPLILARRHHSLPLVLKPNIAHQPRIGKVTVNGGIRSVTHRNEPGVVIVA